MLGCLIFYDRLMMPAPFWPARRRRRNREASCENRHIWRPAPSAAWALYEHSIMLWKWALTGLGVAALATLALAARPMK